VSPWFQPGETSRCGEEVPVRRRSGQALDPARDDDWTGVVWQWERSQHRDARSRWAPRNGSLCPRRPRDRWCCSASFRISVMGCHMPCTACTPLWRSPARYQRVRNRSEPRTHRAPGGFVTLDGVSAVPIRITNRVHHGVQSVWPHHGPRSPRGQDRPSANRGDSCAAASWIPGTDAHQFHRERKRAVDRRAERTRLGTLGGNLGKGRDFVSEAY
jgi:hypothetical protein